MNGLPDPAADPNIGFIIPDIPGQDEGVVTFDAVVDSVPIPNTTVNRAFMAYSYGPVECGFPNIYSEISNEVPLEILSADVSVNKSATPDPVNAGEILTYTIVISNLGPSDAQDVNLTDVIPPEINEPEYSINGGATWNPWTGNYSVGALPPNGAFTTVLIRGTVAPTAIGFVSNTATVTSTTPDPDPSNNTSKENIFVFNFCKEHFC